MHLQLLYDNGATVEQVRGLILASVRCMYFLHLRCNDTYGPNIFWQSYYGRVDEWEKLGGTFCQQGLLSYHIYVFLHDRSWISPWIKSISDALDITGHVFPSRVSGHCDVIGNRLWRHQQTEGERMSPGGVVKILVFSVIYDFVMSSKK